MIVALVGVACEGSAHPVPPATAYALTSMELAAGPSAEPVKVATLRRNSSARSALRLCWVVSSSTTNSRRALD
jgi:hypothetical protein